MSSLSLVINDIRDSPKINFEYFLQCFHLLKLSELRASASNFGGLKRLSISLSSSLNSNDSTTQHHNHVQYFNELNAN